MPVDIYLAKKQENAQEIFASGTMVANEEVELHPEMSGRIVKLNISEGNLVQKGQLIAKIYDADIMARLVAPCPNRSACPIFWQDRPESHQRGCLCNAGYYHCNPGTNQSYPNGFFGT
ncbi:MAG: biotin/lipoyl-binding protein [Saprospiraceae bacterium]|nr:biotin/lipoyl-binding protein [Saprospiraceae bacterium]